MNTHTQAHTGPIDEATRSALRAAVADVRASMEGVDGCDMADFDELGTRVEQELANKHPSPATLGTFLNSIARSARSAKASLPAVEKLDDVMQRAGITRDWET